MSLALRPYLLLIKIKPEVDKFRFNGDCVLEDDVDLILKRLKEYLKNIDGEEFKKIF